MKVVFLANGLTHYYNHVLSKLHSEDDINLTVIAPLGNSSFVGEGVQRTKQGINFPLFELPEKHNFLYSSFSGLSDVLVQIKPNIVILVAPYLRAFMFDLRLKKTMRNIGAKLILKDIPFRLKTYDAAKKEIHLNPRVFCSQESFLKNFIKLIGIKKIFLMAALEIRKKAYQIPDAHVNYIEATSIWESYGVDKSRIFITRNSPDTDRLFSIKKKVERTPLLLEKSSFRIIHVGRLVKWKNVDMLIRVFAKIRKIATKSDLIIIGKGPELNGLKELTHDLQISSYVKFLGGVYDPEILGKYLLESSVYVLAGMGGISINDAMCFGLPVLVSVGDGTEKILVREGVNGKYFKDGSEQDLYMKLKWFVENQNQLSRMGRESIRIIKNDVNIKTVIDGYKLAFDYVVKNAEP